MTVSARPTAGRRIAPRNRVRLLAFGLRTFGAVALLLGIAGLTRSEPWQPVARRPAAAANALAWTQVNPIGANTFLASEVESWKRAKTLDMVADAGIGWIAQQFAWAEIEPQRGVF